VIVGTIAAAAAGQSQERLDAELGPFPVRISGRLGGDPCRFGWNGRVSGLGGARNPGGLERGGVRPHPQGSSEFERRVLEVVAGLKPGEVATYGEIAEEAGHPGAARAVGGVMARSQGVPWWRVVTATGRLVPGHEREQARRLRAEGVSVGSDRIRHRGRG
jgi:methylated-DNA-protein-cysteine methyltransferase-like protein